MRIVEIVIPNVISFLNVVHRNLFFVFSGDSIAHGSLRCCVSKVEMVEITDSLRKCCNHLHHIAARRRKISNIFCNRPNIKNIYEFQNMAYGI